MFNDAIVGTGLICDTQFVTMADILDAARVLQAPGHPLFTSYAMAAQICERLYPSVDPALIRIGLSDDKAMSPFSKNRAWVCHEGEVHVITVLMRHHRDIADLFGVLVHEINHVRQHQIAPGVQFSSATLHRVESWRLAAYEAASALWPACFDKSEFVGVPGRTSAKRRLDDKTLHGFPNRLRARVEAAGHAYVPSWCYQIGSEHKTSL
jgi:hypothetical protein